MQRQRPLQNSMILPEHNSNGSKRSSAPIDNNFPLFNVKKMPSHVNSETHFQYHNIVLQHPNRQNFQHHTASEQNNQSRQNDSIIHQICQKIEKLSRAVEKHQFQLSSLSMDGDFSKKVINQVKKSLPVFTGGNDVYEHIFNIKLQIKSIQEQLMKTSKFSDLESAVKKQFQGLQKKSENSSSTSNLSISNTTKNPQFDQSFGEIIKKRDQVFQNILNNLETEITIVKKNLNNINMEMKVSPIASNSCIMLKYQQLFKARTKSDNDMVLSEMTYYIDNEGYLLDCHSRYIVDQKGRKIKLQDKHINLLRSQKILQ